MSNKSINKKKSTNPKTHTVAAKQFKPQPLPTRNDNKNTWYALFVLAITFISFFPSLKCGFTNLDDQYYVLNNPDVKNLSFSNIKILFSNFYVGNYQPLSMLTYAIENKISGLNPFTYHFTNFILHLLNTLLVFIFIRKLSSNIHVAVIASALFGIHPLHVESVAWISERKDVLYAFFYLSGLITYLNYKETKNIKIYLLTILLFIFSCLSKAMAIPFSIMLILIDYLQMKKINLKILIDKIPFLAISFVFGIVAIYVQKMQGASTFINNVGNVYSFTDRFFLACYSLFFYLYKMFLPLNLAVIHPYPYKVSNSLPMIYIISPVIILLITGAVIYSAKKGKKIIFGFLFFFFNVLQVLQILSVGSAIAADRYFYISSIGLFYIMGESFREVMENVKYKKYKQIGIVIMFIIIFVLSFLTFNQTKVWKNSKELWTQMISVYPKNELAYYNRGVYYLDAKKTDLAYSDFSYAIERNPNYKDAISARIKILSDKKDFPTALDDLNKLIKLNPDDFETYNLRGMTYREMQQNKLAKEDFIKVTQLKPDDYAGYMNLAIQLCIEGNMNESLLNFNKAQKLSPNSYDVYSNRANYYAITKNYDLAITDYNKAIQLDSNNTNTYINKALLESEFKKYDEALKDYKKITTLEPGNAKSYYEIALIYFQKNDKKSAFENAQKAKELGYAVDQKFIESLK
ncbi:MAG TPA: tetratricopeptide repeat protein [Bacteroidales bacterium]|nr:tetratricopeptide repeat protein [Bacteroidales bacterium]HPS17691.1 tetratricopeptide repeat protein [Bacteroidales bacterium]